MQAPNDNIIIPMNHDIKVSLQKIADAYGLMLSDLILTIFFDGISLEMRRRERTRQLGFDILK
jgi:hypothetical protein